MSQQKCFQSTVTVLSIKHTLSASETNSVKIDTMTVIILIRLGRVYCCWFLLFLCRLDLSPKVCSFVQTRIFLFQRVSRHSLTALSRTLLLSDNFWHNIVRDECIFFLHFTATVHSSTGNERINAFETNENTFLRGLTSILYITQGRREHVPVRV